VARYLVDTNVLLRFVKPDDQEYQIARHAVQRLWMDGDDLFYTSQNLVEFWNTCSRPVDRNGYGLSLAEVDGRARLIESQFSLLEDSVAIHVEWRKLLVNHAVLGTQVYDGRLVAAMRVHRIPQILTFNYRDFARYTDIRAISPINVAEPLIRN
jgi:predicted nucleic acid-binding protein